MEPITLCGALIVLFGLWIEFEPGIIRLANAIKRRTPTRLMTSVFSICSKPAYVNRYAPYPR